MHTAAHFIHAFSPSAYPSLISPRASNVCSLRLHIHLSSLLVLQKYVLSVCISTSHLTACFKRMFSPSAYPPLHVLHTHVLRLCRHISPVDTRISAVCPSVLGPTELQRYSNYYTRCKHQFVYFQLARHVTLAVTYTTHSTLPSLQFTAVPTPLSFNHPSFYPLKVLCLTSLTINTDFSLNSIHILMFVMGVVFLGTGSLYIYIYIYIYVCVCVCVYVYVYRSPSNFTRLLQTPGPGVA